MKTTKKDWLILLVFFCIAVFTFVFVSRQQENPLSYRLIEGTAGWGYEIIAQGHILIHQEIIPGSSSQQGFPLPSQAESTARLLISKIKKGSQPVLTNFELTEILSRKTK